MPAVWSKPVGWPRGAGAVDCRGVDRNGQTCGHVAAHGALGERRRHDAQQPGQFDSAETVFGVRLSEARVSVAVSVVALASFACHPVVTVAPWRTSVLFCRRPVQRCAPSRLTTNRGCRKSMTPPTSVRQGSRRRRRWLLSGHAAPGFGEVQGSCADGARPPGAARDFKPHLSLEAGVEPVAGARRIDGAHQRVVADLALGELKGWSLWKAPGTWFG